MWFQRRGGVWSGRGNISHEMTIPRNFEPTLSSLIKPNRPSFLPEHRRGSQWSKSWKCVRALIYRSKSQFKKDTCPHCHGDVYPDLLSSFVIVLRGKNSASVVLNKGRKKPMTNLFFPHLQYSGGCPRRGGHRWIRPQRRSHSWVSDHRPHRSISGLQRPSCRDAP